MKIASLYPSGYDKTNNLTQEELVRGCLRRDPAIQKAVYDLYAGRMLGVCLRYARNHADAEDMLQDAFILVFDKIKQFKGDGSFEGWIRKIVVNTALKKYRLIRYTKEQTAVVEELPGDQYSSEAIVVQHLSEKDLLNLIRQLPDGYRMVFNLYVMEGYQHEEIAQMLNINSGTSRSQLAKARAMLQKQIIALQQIAV